MPSLVALASPSRAQDATWLANPTSGDFDTATNWMPNAVPTGTAFFGASTTTSLSFSASDTSLGGWTFNAGAAAYAFTNDNEVDFTGAGIMVVGGGVAITNNSGALINFSNGSSAGTATITNSGDVAFNDTSTAGSSVFINIFRVNFYDNSTAGNATLTNNGYVYFNDNSSLGSANITNNSNFAILNASTAGDATITNNSLLYFDNTSTAANSVIVNSSTGDLRFYTDSTAGNAIITNNNLLYFNNASTAGNAVVTNNALLYFYDTASGGQAQFINNAGATIDISGGTGPAGDGVIAVGSIAGAGDIALGAHHLVLGSDNLSGTISGAISDGGFSGGSGGALTKTGSGTLTLTGNNTYTGTTTVDGGMLSVDGSIATSGLTTVDAGGTLGGTGVVGNITIANGGTLAPGDAIGTLTVQGNLTLAPSSIYQIAVSPTAADRTSVTGTAALGGTVQATFAAGSYVAKQYTILSAAGGLTGTFAALVNSGLPAGFDSSLSYDADDAYLNLQLALAQYSGLDVNQQNVANALVGSFNRTGGIPAVFAGLAPNGLTAVSGELGTASIQPSIDAMTAFMGVVGDPSQNNRSRPTGCSFSAAQNPDAVTRPASGIMYPSDKCWSVWGASYGGASTTDGNSIAGSHDASSHIYGVVAGADYHLRPDTRVGFALGGAGTNFGVADGLGQGSSDMFQAGFYARQDIGAAYLAGVLAYGWQEVRADRTVSVAATDPMQARFDANAFSGRIESGYRFDARWAGFTPYAAVQATDDRLPAYAELAPSGDNTFALNYAAQSTTATRTEFGLRGDTSFTLQATLIVLRAGAAWAHDFDTDRAVTATFQTLPGASFVVYGASPSPNAALLTAGAELNWRNGVSFAATFQSELSGTVTAYSGKGALRYSW